MTIRKKADPLLAQNIKKYRKQAGLTQKKLGELLNYSTDIVKRWEREDLKISPNLQTLLAICKVLNCSLDDLIGKEGENKIIENEINTGIEAERKKHDCFIKYLQSVGFDVEIVPESVNQSHNINYQYQIFSNGKEIRAFNHDEWIELQSKVSSMVELIIK